MAGHSKFKNIMHRKGAQDAKRAKVFARISREITISARSNDDPEKNPKLRAALALARASNMPKDKIQNAIAKASGAGKEENLDEVYYEGYGPNGVAVIVYALTDNKNRTASVIRSAFNKFGGNLGESGSVAYLFEHVGSLVYERSKIDVDQLMETSMELDAKDFLEEDDYIRIVTDIKNYTETRDALVEKFGAPEEYGLIFLPVTTVAQESETLEKLLNALEEAEDVQEVFTNLE